MAATTEKLVKQLEENNEAGNCYIFFFFFFFFFLKKKFFLWKNRSNSSNWFLHVLSYFYDCTSSHGCSNGSISFHFNFFLFFSSFFFLFSFLFSSFYFLILWLYNFFLNFQTLQTTADDGEGDGGKTKPLRQKKYIWYFFIDLYY